MEKTLVDAIGLENGLVLKLYDGSRKIAADRWRVSCIARVEVPVDSPDAEAFSAAGIDRDEVKGCLGDPVVFEKVLERNFVSEPERKQVVDGIFASMTGSLAPYLSRPEFPGRFLIRRYREYRKQAAWRKTSA